ncbi:hypothetical protein [Streptomyces sp. NPDC059538]|uniref:hypothetical protein n=1 Tax=Streptomyces sp. NPDC059538 TaxID=3346860 RepID=UPI0036738D31
MATYTSRTVTSTRREWIVPAAQPWGAAAEEVEKAWQAADHAYREIHGLRDVPTPGSALRFHVGDEEIIISFTVEAAS